MKFDPLQVVLKNGKTVEIREAQIDDAEELRITIKEYVEESEFVPYAKGEFKLSIEEEKQWIQSFIDIPNGLLLVGIIDGKIVGNIDLNSNKREMLQHTSIIGIGILKEYRGLGLGSIFFQETINWAKNHSSLEFLSLETYATNKVGIALYEKFGFKQAGLLSNFIKVSPNEYVDSITMTLDIR